MKLTLLENAKSAMRHAVEHVRAGRDSENLKWAVLAVSQAIELVMLEAIRRREPKAIFTGDEDDDGRPKTIGWRTALKHVERLYARDGDTVELLISLRNPLMHYELSEVAGTVDATMEEGLGWISSFLAALDEDLTEWVGGDEAYQTLVGIDDTRPHIREIVEGMAHGMEHRDKYIETHLIHCPWCFDESLTVSAELPVSVGTCLSCGHLTDLSYCDRCGQTFAAEELSDGKNGGLCEACMDHIMRD